MAWQLLPATSSSTLKTLVSRVEGLAADRHVVVHIVDPRLLS
jgi:hypothetical protein